MRFAVLGAGAIGAYVGAALARGGSDVTLIARGDHLRAMQTFGVRVESPRGDFTIGVPATSDFAAIAEADVIFLGLKANGLPGVAPELANVLSPDAVVIGAQNGIPWWYFQRHGGRLDGHQLHSVDPGGAVSRAIGPDNVVGCVIYCSTELAAPGVVRHVEGTRFAIGTPSGEVSEECREISAAFAAGGLKCPIAPNLREHIWLKLIGNAAFNPITTITRTTMGDLARSSSAIACVRAVMEECAAVAGALGVELPVSIERRIEGALAVGDHRTSMLLDCEAGKPLELDCMTGAIIEIAELVSVPVPTVRTLHTLTNAVGELRAQFT
ncbi:MAG: 2-dehydropantoate 2-reductase [Solirubrobacterales bacterium]|nr:2-dehydropantoate 2-reductase [Solirubrobacterales bacterium]